MSTVGLVDRASLADLHLGPRPSEYCPSRRVSMWSVSSYRSPSAMRGLEDLPGPRVRTGGKSEPVTGHEFPDVSREALNRGRGLHGRPMALHCTLSRVWPPFGLWPKLK